ncbi:hypothetical protein PsorP6_004586 [Peronosclerospora sorghi]|uniref:Uncharacterized protein n=1 Tax=Peronosclerospora sorghi TaxID=230839 RepID=A0ACC0VLQ4_9STRA|nr:hypothetical protein PsorP6_004586 [Peronosclerospora sorghi]
MTLPKKTSGRDYVMTVSVMDESCPTRAEAIQINVFYPTIAQMPKIKYVGDIIRFHKVKIQEYQGHIQGVSLDLKTRFDQRKNRPRITRHLVLRKRENDTIEQLTCSQSWTFEPSDAERTRELTKWATSCLAKDTTLPQGCPQPPKLLNELKLAENFIDLVVRVLHVEDTNEPPRLIVWDGSGDMTESDATLVSALEGHGIVVPSSGILKEVIMSSCWSVLREIGLVDGILTHWCRFRNLAVGIDEPMPGTTTASETRETLRFREVTSFVLVPDFVVDVQHRLSLITRSIPDSGNDHPLVSSTETPVDVTTIVPAHILRNIPPTSLRDILNSPHTPRKYHCYGRVRRIWPADIEKICKPKPTQKDELVYCFVLTIEDATDSLNVIVYGTHAEHFLSGIPPCDLKKSTSSKTLLEKRLTALLRAPQAFHWCIKSYAVVLPPTDCSRGPTAAIRYRLFDTRLQCL